MCRLAAYTGAAKPLSTLLFDAKHGLEHQAYAPQEMLRGSVNVDGTGIAWWDGIATHPLRYVSEHPPWSDPNLPDLAPRLNSSLQLAAVRSATPGIPFGAANVPPFVAGGLALVHNGWIGDFTGPLGRDIVATIPDDLFPQLAVLNDSRVLFLLAVARYRETGDLHTAVVAAVDAVAATVRRHSGQAMLTVAAADAAGIVALRTSVGSPQNTLYTRAADDGLWLASEPLDDDPRWRALPEHTVTDLRDGLVTTHRLPA